MSFWRKAMSYDCNPMSFDCNSMSFDCKAMSFDCYAFSVRVNCITNLVKIFHCNDGKRRHLADFSGGLVYV